MCKKVFSSNVEKCFTSELRKKILTQRQTIVSYINHMSARVYAGL